MVVLNSRDWSEIVWLLEILHFKNQLCNRLYLKKSTRMHWLGYNDAAPWLNEAKTRIPYSAKLWWGKTLANLAKRMSFANVLTNQIPGSLL